MIIIVSSLAGAIFMISIIYLHRCCSNRRHHIDYVRVSRNGDQLEMMRQRQDEEAQQWGDSEDNGDVDAMFGFDDDDDDDVTDDFTFHEGDMKHIEELERYEEGLRKAASGLESSWSSDTHNDGRIEGAAAAAGGNGGPAGGIGGGSTQAAAAAISSSKNGISKKPSTSSSSSSSLSSPNPANDSFDGDEETGGRSLSPFSGKPYLTPAGGDALANSGDDWGW